MLDAVTDVHTAQMLKAQLCVIFATFIVFTFFTYNISVRHAISVHCIVAKPLGK